MTTTGERTTSRPYGTLRHSIDLVGKGIAGYGCGEALADKYYGLIEKTTRATLTEVDWFTGLTHLRDLNASDSFINFMLSEAEYPPYITELRRGYDDVMSEMASLYLNHGVEQGWIEIEPAVDLLDTSIQLYAGQTEVDKV